MQLGLISLIKNEMDILQPFLKHIDALFDNVYLIDHLSIDGTASLIKEAVNQRSAWEYYLLDFPGNIQQKTINLMINEAFHDGSDFVFILDVDEFLNFSDRKSLEKAISPLTEHDHVGYLRWINCIPKNYEQNKISIYSELIFSPKPSSHRKVVIPKACFYKDDNFYVSRGNHNAFWGQNNEFYGEEIGNIYHVPIRSKQQAVKKAIVSTITLNAVKKQNPNAGYQFQVFIKAISKNRLDDKSLMRFTHIYEGADFINDSNEKINSYWKNGKTSCLLDQKVAFSDKLNLKSLDCDTPLYRIIAASLVNYPTSQISNIDLEISTNTIRLKQTNPKPSADSWQVKEKMNFSKIQKLQDKTSGLQKELNKTQNELSNAYQKINNLEKKVEIQTRQISFFSQSKSWRLTKPLRKIMGFFIRKK